MADEAHGCPGRRPRGTRRARALRRPLSLRPGAGGQAPARYYPRTIRSNRAPARIRVARFSLWAGSGVSSVRRNAKAGAGAGGVRGRNIDPFRAGRDALKTPPANGVTLEPRGEPDLIGSREDWDVVLAGEYLPTSCDLAARPVIAWPGGAASPGHHSADRRSRVGPYLPKTLTRLAE